MMKQKLSIWICNAAETKAAFDYHDVRKSTQQYSIHSQIDFGSYLTPDGMLETSDHLVSSGM
jgi:hypothetical protein